MQKKKQIKYVLIYAYVCVRLSVSAFVCACM